MSEMPAPSLEKQLSKGRYAFNNECTMTATADENGDDRLFFEFDKDGTLTMTEFIGELHQPGSTIFTTVFKPDSIEFIEQSFFNPFKYGEPVESYNTIYRLIIDYKNQTYTESNHNEWLDKFTTDTPLTRRAFDSNIFNEYTALLHVSYDDIVVNHNYYARIVKVNESGEPRYTVVANSLLGKRRNVLYVDGLSMTTMDSIPSIIRSEKMPSIVFDMHL